MNSYKGTVHAKTLAFTIATVLLTVSAVNAAPAGGSGDGAAEQANRGASVSVTSRSATYHGEHPIRYDAVQAFETGHSYEIADFTVADDRQLTLVMQPFEILAPGAQVVAVDAQGGQSALQPDLKLLRGYVAGEDDSHVFIGASPYGVYGFIQHDNVMRIVSTGLPGGKDADEPALYVARAEDVVHPTEPFCQTSMNNPNLIPPDHPALQYAINRGGGSARSAGVGEPPCRVARIAVETDWEFTGNLFAGDVDAAAAYALTLIAADSEIYNADLNIKLTVTYLRLWASDVDPYNAGSTTDMLYQFRDYWQANEQDIPRELAHLLSGDDLGGGVAWLAVLCSFSNGYAVSANLNGFFPYPIEDHNENNWDLMVTAHELGHNFGAIHTHDFSPPIDGCAFDECANADQGTIMSYCHLCDGGLANVNMNFHPQVIDMILAYLDNEACEISAGPTTAVDDSIEMYEDESAVVDILYNDIGASCEPSEVVLDTFDSSSAQDGDVALVPADGPGDRDRLSYDPPAGYSGSDQFTYTLINGSSATVSVDVEGYRPPDVVGLTEPGAAVSYYELTAPQQLPDFSQLEPYANDVVEMVNYQSTGGSFATSGLADEVGAVFEGFVTVPQQGIYTFYTNSDDGSRLYIGDELIVDNDGLHAMLEKQGDIALLAGPHALRIEFFENGGGAGLIASIEGPGLPKHAIAPDLWSHEVSCAADIAGSDGEVAVSDLLALLGAWNTDGVGANLAEPTDIVDVADLLALLSAWGPCE